MEISFVAMVHVDPGACFFIANPPLLWAPKAAVLSSLEIYLIKSKVPPFIHVPEET